MPPPLKGALFVEGKGEQDAAPRLMKRLWQHLNLEPFIDWEVVRQSTNFKDDAHLAAQINAVHGLRNRRYRALVVMFDSDDKIDGQLMCPREKGPSSAAILRAANLPIPSAIVLPYKEYEHWFIACLPKWAGKEVVDPATQKLLAKVIDDTSCALQEINHRDGKYTVKTHLNPVEYEPTIHQSALTNMLDFEHLQDPQIDQLVPAFGTLIRACQQLAANINTPGFVYPPPPANEEN